MGQPIRKPDMPIEPVWLRERHDRERCATGAGRAVGNDYAGLPYGLDRADRGRRRQRRRDPALAHFVPGAADRIDLHVFGFE